MHQFYCWFLLDWFCWSFIWPRATFRSFFKTPSLSQWQQPPMSFFPHFSLRSFISSSAVYSAGRRSVRWPPLNPLTEQESFFQNHEKLSYMVVMGIDSYLLHHLTGSVLITSKTKHCTAFFFLFIYFPSEVGFVCWHRFRLGSVQSWRFVFFFFQIFLVQPVHHHRWWKWWFEPWQVVRLTMVSTTSPKIGGTYFHTELQTNTRVLWAASQHIHVPSTCAVGCSTLHRGNSGVWRLSSNNDNLPRTIIIVSQLRDAQIPQLSPPFPPSLASSPPDYTATSPGDWVINLPVAVRLSLCPLHQSIPLQVRTQTGSPAGCPSPRPEHPHTSFYLHISKAADQRLRRAACGGRLLWKLARKREPILKALNTQQNPPLPLPPCSPDALITAEVWGHSAHHQRRGLYCYLKIRLEQFWFNLSLTALTYSLLSWVEIFFVPAENSG